MGTGTQDTIAPPPPGFEPEEQQGAPPPPPPGFVPEGGTPPPPANRGFMGTLADKISGGLTSLKDAVTSSPTGGYPLTDRRAWFGDKPWSFNPTGEGTIGRQATRPLPKDLDTLKYRMATTLSPLVPGLNPEAMEQASGRGDVGAVAAETAVPLAALAGGEYGGRLVNKLPGAATRLFRGPEGIPREAQTAINPITSPGRWSERELEAKVPQRPWTQEEIRAQRDKGLTEQGETLMRRGEEQAALDAERAKQGRAVPLSRSPYAGRAERAETNLREAETARQKELSDFGRLRTMDERTAAREGRAVPLSRSPYATQNTLMEEMMEGGKGPHNLLSESPNPSRLSEQINEEGAEAEGEGTRDRLVNRVTGKRPSPSERDITNIVRSRIVTPEERVMELRELGPESGVKPGEGQMEREARLLGTARARRAAQGMREPK